MPRRKQRPHFARFLLNNKLSNKYQFSIWKIINSPPFFLLQPVHVGIFNVNFLTFFIHIHTNIDGDSVRSPYSVANTIISSSLFFCSLASFAFVWVHRKYILTRWRYFSLSFLPRIIQIWNKPASQLYDCYVHFFWILLPLFHATLFFLARTSCILRCK